MRNFLENYAEIHGLPSPGRKVNRITQSLTVLPTETSYKSVYRNFIVGLENDSTLKLLKYDVLCSKYESTNGFLQHFRNDLQYNARKDEEARDLLKNIEKLLQQKYEISITSMGLVDEHFITRGKADYCSVDTTAHYSHD